MARSRVDSAHLPVPPDAVWFTHPEIDSALEEIHG